MYAPIKTGQIGAGLFPIRRFHCLALLRLATSRLVGGAGRGCTKKRFAYRHRLHGCVSIRLNEVPEPTLVFVWA